MANRLEIAADVVINGSAQIPKVADELDKMTNAAGRARDALGRFTGKGGGSAPAAPAAGGAGGGTGGTGGGGTGGGGVRDATMAMMSLNRVVQDAPFGLLGIANNIDPLLQSLTALGNQAAPAGATGLQKVKSAGAALLSTFMGPQGILFAISAATSLMLVFGKGLFTNAGQLDAAAKSANAYADALLRVSKEEARLAGETDLERARRERATLQARVQAGTTTAPQRTRSEFFGGNGGTAPVMVTTEGPEVPALKKRIAELDAEILALEKLKGDELVKNIELYKKFEENKRAGVQAEKEDFNAMAEAMADESFNRILTLEQRAQNEEDLAKRAAARRLAFEQESAEKEAKRKLEWAKWYADERRKIEEQIFENQVSIAFNTAAAIQGVNEAFLGNNRTIQAAAIGVQKVVAIAQIISDGIAKSAAATASAALFAANPATAALAASYARSALLIRASTAAAATAVAAQAAAQIAALYQNNGNAQTAQNQNVTIQAGYTGFSASANPAAVQQERAGTQVLVPVQSGLQKLQITDGMGNLVARGQLEIQSNPNLQNLF